MQGEDDSSDILPDPGSPEDMVLVSQEHAPDEPAHEQKKDDFSTDPVLLDPGTPEDMVPVSQDPASYEPEPQQKEDDFSKESVLPLPGIPEDTVSVFQDPENPCAIGDLIPALLDPLLGPG